jgi:cardiolipin synthase
MRDVLTLANGLTVARLALAPVFLWLYVSGDLVRALAAFAAAAATDVLDGLVARALDQRTRLGEILDPIADKTLAACALFALAARESVPMWLPLLAVTRDVAQLLGAAALKSAHRPVPIRPTRIGKYATFLLAVVVVTALAAEYGGIERAAAGPYVAALSLLAAECLVVSWAQYFISFLRTAREHAPAGS